MTRTGIGIVAAFAAGVLFAQQPAEPRFDVVSIREVPPNTPPSLRSQDFTAVLPGGQFIDPRTPLSHMIVFAYGVKSYLQLAGLPGWADAKSFSVAAKPAESFPVLSPDENREQVRLMMRAMLAERFHLKLHTETRQERVMKLETAKGAIKVQEVEAPVPPAKEGPVNAALGDRGGRIIGKKVDHGRHSGYADRIPETASSR